MISSLAISALVDEAERYFAALPGPGIAAVRSGLAAWRGGPVSPAAPAENSVVREWLPVALASVAPARPALASAILAAAPYLGWTVFDGYPVDAVGVDFMTGHAYAPIIGEAAAIPATDWELGLFLMRPQLVYRDHRHRATESYAPLTGPHGWRFGAGRPLTLLDAHQPVWNESLVPHLIKVGSMPFLCLYAWTSHVNAGAEIVPATDWSALEELRL